MNKRDRRKNPKETEFHELCDSTLVFSSFYEESVLLVHGILHVSWEYARQTDHKQTFVRSAT